MNDVIHIPNDLLIAQKIAYQPNGFSYKNLIIEDESQEYKACKFMINSLRVEFRVAKITPKKIGQFVTFWKRTGKEPIQPYDVSDELDIFVVSVRNNKNFGQFVFPKSVLYEKGILSKNGVGGKLAIRVYAPWDNPISKQAQKTKLWQVEYFFFINYDEKIDNTRIKKLFFSKV